VGIIISGNPKRVLITAKGKTLALSGVSGFLSDPKIDLYDIGGNVIATNESWRSHPESAEIEASGVAPVDNSEAAMILSLEPGLYTAIVSGENASTGVALVEVSAVP
jgi:hypothetical protein